MKKFQSKDAKSTFRSKTINHRIEIMISDLEILQFTSHIN